MRNACVNSLLALAASCAPEPVPAAPSEVGVRAEDTRPDLADLEALGYVHVDEGPAGSLADPRAPGDSGEAAPRAGGPSLYTDDRSRVLLIDETGTRRHTWTIPGFDQVEHAILQANGDVVVVSVDQGFARVGRSGEVVWSVACQAHHDVAPAADGGFWGLVWRERTWNGRRVRFDLVVHLAADGTLVERLDTFELRPRLAELHPPLPLDLAPQQVEDSTKVYDYYHLNAVSEIPRDVGPLRRGDLLLCARNASLVFAVDPRTRTLRWQLEGHELDFPHAPGLTDSDTLLVFDNGWHRGYSRLLEFDLTTTAVVWRYEGRPRTTFFTKTRGYAQRLADGHTLVTESERGRAFELDPAGNTLWTFENPELRDGRRRRIYRLQRVPATALEDLAGDRGPR